MKQPFLQKKKNMKQPKTKLKYVKICNNPILNFSGEGIN